MRKLLAAFLLSLPVLPLSAQSDYEAYIEKWAPTAVSEMYRTGVPASITLAQGLLESAAGKSRLATEGNNHFGIKCASWTGQTIYHDDDRKGECFRKYASAAESFADHSNFLRYQKRYQTLFDLELTDYKGWAAGLKAAGYATDPTYASKLTGIIEKFALAKYDKAPAEEETGGAEKAKPLAKPGRGQSARQEIPESPTVLERPQVSSSFRFSLSRQVYEINGVPFVYSVEGETYASIASDYSLFLKEILKFNDLRQPCELLPGTVVFIQAKKNKAVKGLEMHVVENPSETIRDISQRYGVRMKAVMKLNRMKQEPAQLVPASMIRLR